MRKKYAGANLTEEQLTAEGDKSPGVLMASGYIAGGAIAGILIAFMAGVLTDFTRRITDWSTAHNPFFGGPHADLLSLIPFVLPDSGSIPYRSRGTADRPEIGNAQQPTLTSSTMKKPANSAGFFI